MCSPSPLEKQFSLMSYATSPFGTSALVLSCNIPKSGSLGCLKSLSNFCSPHRPLHVVLPALSFPHCPQEFARALEPFAMPKSNKSSSKGNSVPPLTIQPTQSTPSRSPAAGDSFLHVAPSPITQGQSFMEWDSPTVSSRHSTDPSSPSAAARPSRSRDLIPGSPVEPRTPYRTPQQSQGLDASGTSGSPPGGPTASYNNAPNPAELHGGFRAYPNPQYGSAPPNSSDPRSPQSPSSTTGVLSPTSSYQDPVRSGYQSPAASSSGASSTHLSPRRPNDYDRNGATTRTSSGVPSRHDSPGGATDPRFSNAGPPRGANSRSPYDGAFPTNPQDPRRGSNPFPQSNAPRYDPKKHHSDGWAANTDRKR